MERAAFTIYLIILLLSILLFGAMHTYVYTLMALGVFESVFSEFSRADDVTAQIKEVVHERP